MDYGRMILELLDRIQKLESDVEELKRQLGEAQQPLSPLALRDEEQQLPPLVLPEKELAAPTRYTRMTNEMISLCYEKAVEAFSAGQTDMRTANRLGGEISDISGMNPSSASIYVYVVISMLQGKTYKRAISENALRLILSRIEQEQGPQALRRAITATRGNIAYREADLGQRPEGFARVCDEFERRL